MSVFENLLTSATIDSEEAPQSSNTDIRPDEVNDDEDEGQETKLEDRAPIREPPIVRRLTRAQQPPLGLT